jgi:uncharacterized protein DUF3124
MRPVAILATGRHDRSWGRIALGARAIRLHLPVLLAVFAVLPCAQPGLAAGQGDALAPFKDSLTAPPDAAQLTRRQTVYVPVYSSLAGVGGLKQLDFSVTLSIRNVAPDLPLVLERIDYHDTAGRLVQHYLREAVAVRPLGTVEILIPTEDVRGGTGAKFIVGWAASAGVAAPVIQAVMVGGAANRGFALTTEGVPIP